MPAVVIGQSIIGIQVDGLGEVLDGTDKIACSQVGSTTVVICLSMIGIQVDGLGEVLDGTGKIALVLLLAWASPRLL